jgi:Tfp pilus assembly protein PilN
VKRATGAPLVLEWGPQGILAFDPVSGIHSEFGTLEAAAASLGTNREAVVAVSRRAMFLRTTRVPNTSPEEIRQVLVMKLAGLFPTGNDELAFDFVLFDDVNVEGRLALVGAMPAQELKRLYLEVRTAGFRIARVVPAAFGSISLLEDLGRASGAVAQPCGAGICIDLVEGCVVRYSRVAPPGGSLDVELARTRAVVGLPDLPVIAAGGLEVPEAEVTTKTSSLEAFSNHPRPLPFNLEPREAVMARKVASRRRRQRLAALMAVAAVAVGTLAYFDYAEANAAVQRELQATRTSTRKLQTAQSATASELTQVVQVRESLDRAYHPPQRFGDVLRVVANTAPAGVWLTGVSVERGRPMTIRGTSLTNEAVAEYLRILSGHERFRDVRIVFANNATIGETTVVQFSISMFPVGNLPVIEQGARAR